MILSIEEGEQEVTVGKGCEDFRFCSIFSSFHLIFIDVLHYECFIMILYALRIVKGGGMYV